MKLKFPDIWLKYYIMILFKFYLYLWDILKNYNLCIQIILLIHFAIDIYKNCTIRSFHIEGRLLDHWLNFYKFNSNTNQTIFLTHHRAQHFLLIILFINQQLVLINHSIFDCKHPNFFGLPWMAFRHL
jgi:hypothetical protein